MFATGFAQNEPRYMWRHHQFQNVGTGFGSGGVHWNGQIWRFLPSDFVTKSHNAKRYGMNAVTGHDMTVQDWGTQGTQTQLPLEM